MNRQRIWHVELVEWDCDHKEGRKTYQLVEASTCAGAVRLVGEDDMNEIVKIQEVGIVVAREGNLETINANDTSLP